MRVIVALAVAGALGLHAVPAGAAERLNAHVPRALGPIQESEPEPEPEPPTPTPTPTPPPPPPDPQMPVARRWGFGATDPGGITAGVGTTPVSAGSEGDGGGSVASGPPARPFDCLVIELDPLTEGLGTVTPGLRNYDVDRAEAIVEGGRYYQECWYLDTGQIYYADVWDQGPLGTPGVNLRVLAQSALSRTPFTVPVPGMAPSMDGEQITGFPSLLWLDPADWEPIVAEAAAAGVWVRVTATPVRADWDMGDGTVVGCDGPGVVWNVDGPNPDDTDCEHVFQHTSVDEPDGRYAGSVTIVWSIAWVASTGETGTLPEGRSSTPLSLLVNEMQAVVCQGTLEDCPTPDELE